MYQITSRFHEHESFRSHGHLGIDFAMDNHTPLRSIKDGVVSKITHYQGNIGNGVLIKWEDGKTAIYGHMSKISDNLKVGDHVNAGQLIGYSGNSGHVVGANGGYHLHFGLKARDGHFLDPSPYIDDIQNMNTKHYIAQHMAEHIPNVAQIKINFFDYMNSHMNVVHDSLSSLKIHLISSLTNDVLFIKIFEQLFQFISAHSGLLNFIFTHIV